MCTGGEAGGGMESCFLRALSKREQKPVHEHVDISSKLAAAGLLEHLPSEAWPPMNAVRELNSKIKSLQKAGQEVAFVAVDLCKCVFVRAVLVLLRVLYFVAQVFAERLSRARPCELGRGRQRQAVQEASGSGFVAVGVGQV